MALTRQQKTSQVDWVSQVLSDNDVLVLMQNHGLTVAEVSDLRTQMRAVGGGVKVVKNRLASIALNKVDGGEAAAALLTGPVVIAYSADPVTAPKVVVNFVKDNESLTILGGLFDGNALDLKGITALSKMPSREEILSSISGCLTAPGSNISSAAGAPAANLAGIVKTIAEKEDA